MYDCNLYGGRFLGQDGAPGLRVDSNSDVFASGCYIEGGSGFEGKLFFCSGDGGAGVAAMSAVSNVDLLDTQTVGGARISIVLVSSRLVSSRRLWRVLSLSLSLSFESLSFESLA